MLPKEMNKKKLYAFIMPKKSAHQRGTAKVLRVKNVRKLLCKTVQIGIGSAN